MRHITGPLLLVNQQYRQLKGLIQISKAIDRSKFKLLHELEQLITRFQENVEHLYSTLEISIRLGINFVPKEATAAQLTDSKFC